MQFTTPSGALEAQLSHVTVAGWTGRDGAAVQHHIEELAALGVRPPSTVPLYYRVSPNLLTQARAIQVLGPDTSGEVEPLILQVGGVFYLGLGSDHTDRALEAVSVAASKQICPKPIAPMLWPLADVQDHLDALTLSTEIDENGAWVSYQEGTFAAIRPLDALIEGAALVEGSAMFCGTLAAVGGVRPAAAYRMTLTDPLRNRTITLRYAVETLPNVS
ncbi:MAG: DUF2848 domain-containing protein [Pseudomonadota bacterium]